MNPYTQPDTDEERAKAEEFRRQGLVPFLGCWLLAEDAEAHERAAAAYNDDGPNPGEFDYFALNREFS